MTQDQIQPDANIVIADLCLQIANLTRENAILKATVQAVKFRLTPSNPANLADGGELQS